MPIAKARIKAPTGNEILLPVLLPALDEVRHFAADLHSRGQAWEGEAFGWPAEYSPERPEPPLDSKLSCTPADFCIGESGVWFFSFAWEHGKNVPPVEFLEDRNIPVVT